MSVPAVVATDLVVVQAHFSLACHVVHVRSCSAREGQSPRSIGPWIRASIMGEVGTRPQRHCSPKALRSNALDGRTSADRVEPGRPSAPWVDRVQRLLDNGRRPEAHVQGPYEGSQQFGRSPIADRDPGTTCSCLLYGLGLVFPSCTRTGGTRRRPTGRGRLPHPFSSRPAQVAATGEGARLRLCPPSSTRSMACRRRSSGHPIVVSGNAAAPRHWHPDQPGAL